MMEDLKKKVLDANISYHSALSQDYDKSQPHFLPENVARVDAILKSIAPKAGRNSLLDLGCGTGFIINIAKKYFNRIVGIDITSAMLDQVDTSGGHIELFKSDTSDLSFLAADSFDVCTSYSFLHHLMDFEPTLRQAYRCLRSGGVWYSDQDPNRHYWQLIQSIQDKNNLPEIISQEVHSVVKSFDETIIGTDITLEDASLAEYHDISKGGIDADELIGLMKSIGFSSAECHYEWYMGQGKILHQQSPADANMIEIYLRDLLPASRFLFKYFSIFAEK